MGRTVPRLIFSASATLSSTHEVDSRGPLFSFSSWKYSNKDCSCCNSAHRHWIHMKYQQCQWPLHGSRDHLYCLHCGSMG
ncbi:unnamed protein product [Acanthoscelides obtectus]|uniref:Uncharacterized protein n=1 Tax=Acanthoscelides obtectus TaxID=200917 RepID=A0A9P0NVK0_ACAOB|nr:unnamed protein product [Acanthoscelides obtectus]CAK1647832.1 hypothetical protein AOBTE_LOCUS15422 [Acanthoscelides obtectus]